MEKTVNEIPALMTVICNIQTIEKRINTGKQHTFKELENMSGNELWELQKTLLQKYNNCVGTLRG